MADAQPPPEQSTADTDTAVQDKASEAADSVSGLGSTAQDASAKSTSQAKQKPKADDGKMWIKVYSPYQVYFDEQAQSISAVNETGPFDILAHHHKFLTLLEPCEIVIRDEGKDEQKIKIARGVMFVKEDRVTVFLDI